MASRMQLGRNIWRYVSARALSATSVPSFPRGGIPLGNRCYSSRVPPSEVRGFLDPVVPHLSFFWGVFVIVTADLSFGEYCREAEKIKADTRNMRYRVTILKEDLEEERLKKEVLKKSLGKDVELAGSILK